LVDGAACAYGAPAIIRFIAPAVPEKVRKIGEILGVKFDGTEDAETIGRKAADAYVAFRDGLGLKPLSDHNIDKTAALALAKDLRRVLRTPLAEEGYGRGRLQAARRDLLNKTGWFSTLYLQSREIDDRMHWAFLVRAMDHVAVHHAVRRGYDPWGA